MANTDELRTIAQEELNEYLSHYDPVDFYGEYSDQLTTEELDEVFRLVMGAKVS